MMANEAVFVVTILEFFNEMGPLLMLNVGYFKMGKGGYWRKLAIFSCIYDFNKL
jgi:hypothetical protein